MISMNRKALRRIPLDKLMDLKVDYAFKQLFGSERNKNITVVFLNAILQRTGRDTVKEVAFINTEFNGEHVDDKQSRLDIVVKTQTDELINVEIQLSNQHDMVKRTLYYWSKLYGSQMKRGMGYYKLLPTITINICNFTVFENIEKYHSTFHLYEDETMQPVSIDDNVLEIHFIEMNKFISMWHDNKLNPLDDILARWLLLLGMVDARKQKVYDEIYQELEELAMKDEHLLEAFNVWEELSQSPDSVTAYQSRLKYILDEEAKYDHAKHEGEEKKTREVISNGIKNNIPLETLALLTNLSIQEVEKIADSLK